jgi:hypothetical protein
MSASIERFHALRDRPARRDRADDDGPSASAKDRYGNVVDDRRTRRPAPRGVDGMRWTTHVTPG